jgi:hypothetical protein
MRKIIILAIFTFSFIFTADAQTTKTVKIPNGKESVTLKSSVVGNKYVDFVVKLNTNQVLSAKVLTKKVAFVIIEPDGEPMADTYGIRDITTQIDTVGTYKIRVMREDSSTKKKNIKTDFTIYIEVTKLK